MAQQPRRQRRQGLPTLDENTLPETGLDAGGGGANAIMARTGQALAAQLSGILDRRENYADQVAGEQAATEGMAAGTANPAARQDGESIRARSFNRAATEAGLRTLEIGVRDRLDEIARDHGSDPVKFNELAGAHVQGVRETLPPDTQARFAMTAEALLQPYRNQVRRNADSAAADERVATFNAAADRRIAAIQRLGRQAPGDAAARTALEAELEAHAADLANLGPRGAFTWRGREYPADPTRAGALTLVQLQAAYGRANDEATEATVLGTYNAGPRSAAWIESWRQRELGPNGSGLRAEQVEKLAREMRADAASREALAREGQASARARLQLQTEENNQAVALTGRPVHTITDDKLRAAGLDAAAIGRFREGERFNAARYEAGQLIPMATPEQLAELRRRFMPGTPLFAANPAAAAGVVRAADQRETAISRDDLGRQVETLVIGSRDAGRPIGFVSEAQGAAAGLSPEETRETNRRIIEAAARADAEREEQQARRDTSAAAYALQRQIADAEVEAGTTGRVTLTITPERAREAGITAEQMAEGNRRIQAAAATGQLVRDAPLLSPQNVAEITAGFALTAEDQTRARAFTAVMEASRKSLDAAPGDHVLRHNPAVAEAWRDANTNPTAFAAAAQFTLDEQARLGVPEARRQAVPPSLAASFVASITSRPTMPERVEAARDLLDRLPDQASRDQALAAMKAADMPQPLAIAVQLAPRLGTARAARVASELATEPPRVLPEVKRQQMAEVESALGGSDGLLTLRRAQYQATGRADFLETGTAEAGLVQHVALVRAGAEQASSSAAATTAASDIFGGRTVINRPGEGVLVDVPTGTDVAVVRRGLQALRDQAVESLLPTDMPAQERAQAALQLRSVLTRGTWVNAGTGFAFYPTNSPFPVALPGGDAVVVQLDRVLTAGNPPQFVQPIQPDGTRDARPRNPDGTVRPMSQAEIDARQNPARAADRAGVVPRPTGIPGRPPAPAP